jgi:hypothetical protein
VRNSGVIGEIASTYAGVLGTRHLSREAGWSRCPRRAAQLVRGRRVSDVRGKRLLHENAERVGAVRAKGTGFGESG